ncbi:uncharacterized protein N7479_002645 [Penicillium vulpinum]|uniref:uncharacterized protein n=1 Tax=Penicillium vulpinum TaxID=29845 RepID=UPI002548836B|nr:uncharacterized protein N7479_002645 [Penicillium vulpinum]KAJ5972727.1 hypothetical protein N7479_002645 [Penicillium vulpinum]
MRTLLIDIPLGSTSPGTSPGRSSSQSPPKSPAESASLSPTELPYLSISPANSSRESLTESSPQSASLSLIEGLPRPTSPAKSPTEPLVKSLSQNAPLPIFTVPLGWTTNPVSTVYKEEWEGQIMARCYVLEPRNPIMEDDNAYTTIFQSGDKLYLWERMCDDLYEISCRDIRELALTISDTKLRELHRELIFTVLDFPN